MFSNVFNVCVCCKSLYFTVRYTKDCEGRVQDSEFYNAVYPFNQDLQLSLTTSVPCTATCVIIDPEVIRFQQIKEDSELWTNKLCRESYSLIFVFLQACVGESHFHGHHITAILTSSSAVFSPLSDILEHFVERAFSNSCSPGNFVHDSERYFFASVPTFLTNLKTPHSLGILMLHQDYTSL